MGAHTHTHPDLEFPRHDWLIRTLLPASASYASCDIIHQTAASEARLVSAWNPLS